VGIPIQIKNKQPKEMITPVKPKKKNETIPTTQIPASLCVLVINTYYHNFIKKQLFK
jgi:hypothetical protein